MDLVSRKKTAYADVLQFRNPVQEEHMSGAGKLVSGLANVQGLRKEAARKAGLVTSISRLRRTASLTQ
jgi:hypothetical protein